MVSNILTVVILTSDLRYTLPPHPTLRQLRWQVVIIKAGIGERRDCSQTIPLILLVATFYRCALPYEWNSELNLTSRSLFLVSLWHWPAMKEAFMRRGLVVLNIDRFSPKLALHNHRGSFSVSSLVAYKQKVDKFVKLCLYLFRTYRTRSLIKTCE